MPTVVRGSDSTFRVILKQGNGIPVDLTACEEVTVTVIDDNGAPATRTLTGEHVSILSPKGAGVLDVALASDFTAAMKLGERLDFMLELTIAGRKLVHVVEGQLHVKPKLGAS